MKFAHALEPQPNEKWHLARQMGIDTAVAIAHPDASYPVWDYLSLARLKKRYEDAGFDLAVLEGWPTIDAIRRNAPERDAEMEVLKRTIVNMGALEIPILCYSWMSHFSWMRTSVTTVTRGGALTTSYTHALTEASPDAKGPLKITEAELWDSFTRFLHEIVPVAEKAGVKLALHPDDPPLTPIMGVSRIFTTVEAFERALSIVESEANGITFCQGNFAAMNAPIPETIHRLGKSGRMHFVHFRDLQGDARNLIETFHDDGKTDMFAAMKAYREIGFSGPMRPDHTPSMHGDANTFPGYEPRGRLFAIGYMKGLLEGVDAMRAAEQASPGRR